MQGNNMIKKGKTKFSIKPNHILVSGSLLIFIFIYILTTNINFIGATADELGYLSTPAQLAGWQWEEAFQNYPFYGIGVGLLWFPLFFLFKDFVVIYKGIILLNALFLIASYWVSFACFKRIFKEFDERILAIICLVISFYPSNIFYAQDALSETLLYLLFWLSFFAVINIIESEKLIWYIFLTLIQGYMLIVHMRSIVILIAMSIFLFLMNIKNKKNWGKIILFLIGAILGFLLMRYIQALYTSGISTGSDINVINTDLDVIGAVLRIFYNLPAFFSGIIAEIFAFSVSGGICLFFGGVFCIKKGLEIFSKREKKLNLLNGSCLYLCLVFACCLIVFATNKSTLTRMDSIVYLRYMENIVGPILGIGIISFGTNYEKGMNNIKIMFSLLILIGAQIVLRAMELAERNVFDTSSSVVIGSFFEYYVVAVDNSYTLLKIVTVVLGFTFVLFAVLDFRKIHSNKISLVVIVMAMALYWGYVGYYSITEQLEMKSNNYEQYQAILDFAVAEDKSKIIYLQENLDNNDLKKAKYLQTLLGRESLRVASKGDNTYFENNINDTLILVDVGEDIEIFDLEENDFIKVFTNDVFDCYIPANDY